MQNNIINCNFKNNKKSYKEKRRKRIKFVAIVGIALMISGIIGSIFYYI